MPFYNYKKLFSFSKSTIMLKSNGEATNLLQKPIYIYYILYAYYILYVYYIYYIYIKSYKDI